MNNPIINPDVWSPVDLMYTDKQYQHKNILADIVFVMLEYKRITRLHKRRRYYLCISLFELWLYFNVK